MSHYFDIVKDRPPRQLFPGVVTRTAWLELLMFSVVDLEPGAEVPMHQHPHEQMGIVISGAISFTIDGETRTLRAGEMYKIPGNIPHSATAVGEHTKVLDVFSPVRDEYK